MATGTRLGSVDWPLRSKLLRKRMKLKRHVAQSKLRISPSLAENLLEEDPRRGSNDTEDSPPVPLMEESVHYEPFEALEDDSGDSGSNLKHLYTIPTVTSLEEVSMQQYYNSFLNTSRWQVSNLNVKPGDSWFLLWFAFSSYIPLICSCSGPLSNLFSLFAIICSWKAPKDSYAHQKDPIWCYIVNLISILFAVVSNGYLLLNYRKAVRYTYCQVISILGWLIASVMLTVLIIVYHWWFYHNHHDDESRLGFGFWFAIITVVFHFLNFTLLSLNELGFLLKKYKPVFNIDHVQSSLIMQTLCLCIWLGIGGGIFTRLLNVELGESFFYCVMSITTIGFQGYVPHTVAAETVTSVWIVIGLVFFGLIISSIRKMIVEFSKSTFQWHRVERVRGYIYDNHRKGGNADGEEIDQERSFELMHDAIKWAYLMQGVSELSLSIVIFLIRLLCGAIGFKLFEQWTYGESVYFCFFSLMTLGDGDRIPITPGGMVFFCAWALSAIPVMTILVSTAADFIFSKMTTYSNSQYIDMLSEFCLKHKLLRSIGKSLERDTQNIYSKEKLLELKHKAGVKLQLEETDDESNMEKNRLNIPMSSRPVDLLLNVLLDFEKLDDLRFINSQQYLKSNTMSVNLANYNREGFEADYDPVVLERIEKALVNQLGTLDNSLDINLMKRRYGLLPGDNDDGLAGVINRQTNKIETIFKKKQDYILSMLSEIQVVVLQLKRSTVYMSTNPDYKHSFEEWDTFMKITKNRSYRDDPLFWIEEGNPITFPTNEPSYFTLHYLRHLDLLIQEFAVEYDDIEGVKIPK